MAEKSNNEQSNDGAATSSRNEEADAGGWWGSWLSSAKSKSAEVYTMVKKDLDEIGTAVKSEASHVFNTTSTAIGKTLKLDEPESPANVMKKSLSSFIGQVNTVLNPEPDDEDTEVILSSGDTTMLSTYKKELEALQRVDATFIVPAYSAEFEAWRASVESPEVIGPNSALRRLEGNPELRKQYERLVPDAVSHEEFWERYLFRVALLQDRLAAASRRQPQEEPTTDPVLAHLPLQTQMEPIVESPKKVLSPEDSEPDVPETPETVSPIPDLDRGVVWDDADFANDMELTEEQQIILLQEYEKEITSKKQSKQSRKDIVNNNLHEKPKTTTKVAHKIGKQETEKPKAKVNMQSKVNKQDGKTTDKVNSIKIKPANANNKNVVSKQVNANKSKVSPKKTQKVAKSDDCGNNLVEDYFDDKEVQIVKDDASANSDESWEKEFEIEDDILQTKA